MAERLEDENDLQALVSLLADIERQLTSDCDQVVRVRLQDLHRRCVLEFARLEQGKPAQGC